MPELDRERLDTIVTAAADRLEGDWLLLGGALVALWLEPRRVTEDVDLVALSDEPGKRLALLQLADELGYPVETLNSAADFFVRRIAGWEAQLELFRTGARGRILRPTATLFILLKCRRLSEQDLADCRAVIARAARDALPIDRSAVVTALDALPPTEDVALSARRGELRALVDPRPLGSGA